MIAFPGKRAIVSPRIVWLGSRRLEVLGLYADPESQLIVPSRTVSVGATTIDWDLFLDDMRLLLGFEVAGWYVNILESVEELAMGSVTKFCFRQKGESWKLLNSCLVVVVDQGRKVALVENSLAYDPKFRQAGPSAVAAAEKLGDSDIAAHLRGFVEWQIADEGILPEESAIFLDEIGYRSQGLEASSNREIFELTRLVRVVIVEGGRKKTVEADLFYRGGEVRIVPRGFAASGASARSYIFTSDPFTAFKGKLPGPWNDGDWLAHYDAKRDEVELDNLSIDSIGKTISNSACSIVDWVDELSALSGGSFSRGQLAAMVLYWTGKFAGFLALRHPNFQVGELRVDLLDKGVETVYDESSSRGRGGIITFGGPEDDYIPDCLDGALVLHEYVHHLQHVLGFSGPDHMREGIADGLSRIFLEQFSDGTFTYGLVFRFENIQRVLVMNRDYSRFAPRGYYAAGSFWCECLWLIFYEWRKYGIPAADAAELLVLAHIDVLLFYTDPADVRISPGLKHSQARKAAVEGHLWLAGCLVVALSARRANSTQIDLALGVFRTMKLYK